MRRLTLVSVLVAVLSLFFATSAEAVVVNDQGTVAGAALAYGTKSQLGTVGVTTQTSGGPCSDPWLSSDLQIANYGLCWHSGGTVMHSNEPFALTWDLPTPNRRHWETTRQYMQQYLRDVADSSGNLSTPYAITPQYRDPGGSAGNASTYGGGCIDLGASGGFTCDFGDSTGSGSGHNYPANGCQPGGTDPLHLFVDGSVGPAANDTCLTDAQIQAEVSAASSQVSGHLKPGYTPLVVVMTPPGVVDCLDAPGGATQGRLCSTNGSPAPPTPQVTASNTGGTVGAGTYKVEITYQTPSGESPPSGVQNVVAQSSTSSITVNSPPQENNATGYYVYVSQNGGAFQRQGPMLTVGATFTMSTPPSAGASAPAPKPSFCSYHSQVGGLAYVVVPWTPLTTCDEPNVPSIDLNNPPPADKLAQAVGARLVSPLSQAHIAAITNPMLNGWIALDGSEVNDNNGCHPLEKNLDQVSVGSSAQNPYYLQREWNNAAAAESDPDAPGCALVNTLSPAFVTPSAVQPGDVVEFDGSATASTLIIPKANYHWDFGDGVSAVGPSVVHTYAHGGDYNVTLTVTDRGGNTRSLSHTISVLGANGKPIGGGGGNHGAGNSVGGWSAHIQLMPQALRKLLRSGVALRVRSNRRADGIATLTIPRALARRAHIRAGKGSFVVIGRGTVSRIQGTRTLHVKVSRSIARKLRRLHHLNLTIRLALVAAGHEHLALVAAGRY